MAQASFQTLRQRREFAYWLRTGRLGNGDTSPEFKFNPWHDPADGRFTWANSGRFYGQGSATGPEGAAKPRGPATPADPAGYDGPEIVVMAPRGSEGRQRVWPVAGNGAPTVRGARGPNGQTYADGRFSREGRYRIDRRTRRGRAHMGIDLPGTLGDPVRAAADGVVEFAGHAGDYGYSVRIRHADGTTTGYGHLHTIIVPNGSAVRAGQSIGTMGNTGNAQHTGTHLHFEVAPPGSSTLRRGYRRSDPTHWIVTGVHQ